VTLGGVGGTDTAGLPHFIIRLQNRTFAEILDLFEPPSEFQEALRVAFPRAFRSMGRILLLETKTRDIVLAAMLPKEYGHRNYFPATTPAFIAFSQLESWLASSGALQLPLHQIELQQQTKGREPNTPRAQNSTPKPLLA